MVIAAVAQDVIFFAAPMKKGELKSLARAVIQLIARQQHAVLYLVGAGIATEVFVGIADENTSAGNCRDNASRTGQGCMSAVSNHTSLPWWR